MLQNQIAYCFENYIQTLKNSKNDSINKISVWDKYKKLLPDGFIYDYPANVTLKITSGCNLRCKHCFYASNTESYNDTNEFSTEELLNILEFLADDLNILSLLITGGEPLLRNDFIQIVEFIKNKNIPLNIQTNGISITKEIAKKLSQILYNKTDLIQISLEGSDQNSHDEIRGKGAFNKTVNAIEYLRHHNIPVQINSTLTSISERTITDIFELCKKLDVKLVSFNRYRICDESQAYLDLSLEKLFETSYRLYNKNKEYPAITAKIKTLDIFDFIKHPYGKLLLDNYLSNNVSGKLINKCITCHNHNKITIGSKGDIFLCSMDESPEAILGNLRTQNFYEIWENRFKTPYFQKKDMTTTKCNKCKYISLCGTGCMASAYKKYGDINMAPAECPYFEKYVRGLNE